MPKMSIFFKQELYDKIKAHKRHINCSKICQQAIEDVINERERRLNPDNVRMESIIKRLIKEKTKMLDVTKSSGIKDGIKWSRTASYKSLTNVIHVIEEGNTFAEDIARGFNFNHTPSVQVNESNMQDYWKGFIDGIMEFYEDIRKELGE